MNFWVLFEHFKLKKHPITLFRPPNLYFCDPWEVILVALGSMLVVLGSILVTRGAPWMPEGTFGVQRSYLWSLLMDLGCPWGSLWSHFGDFF